MLVKICGIKTIEDAHVAMNAGADFIGFVFAPSQRKISPEEAVSIARSLPLSIKTVGVFVNESAEEINRISQLVGLNMVQLHGNEPPGITKQISCKVIKAFSINKINERIINSYSCDYYLIDSPPNDNYQGGSGETFDWNILDQLCLKQKLILAGGLTPQNVQQAIRTVKPIGVDVSSGVETNGKKDQTKIKQFILNVKG